jgi:hypothetical protein
MGLERMVGLAGGPVNHGGLTELSRRHSGALNSLGSRHEPRQIPQTLRIHAVGGESAMTMKVEVSYRAGVDEDERLKQVAQILSEAVYAYLKRRGLLKEGSGGAEKVADLPKEAQAAGLPAGETEGEDS